MLNYTFSKTYEPRGCSGSVDYAEGLASKMLQLHGRKLNYSSDVPLHTFFSKHAHNLEVDFHEVSKTSNTGEKVTVFFRTAFENLTSQLSLARYPNIW